MDPLGFALENFNAVADRANDPDTLTLIDTAGQLPDGTRSKDLTISAALVDRPDHQFVQAFTENLMTYARQPRLSRHAHGSPHRPSGSRRRLSFQVHRPWRRFKRCVPQEEADLGRALLRRPKAGVRARSRTRLEECSDVVSSRSICHDAPSSKALVRPSRSVAGRDDPGRNGAGADGRGGPRLGFSTSRTARCRTSGRRRRPAHFDFPFILKPLEPRLRDRRQRSAQQGRESSSPHGIIEETWLNCVSPRLAVRRPALA